MAKLGMIASGKRFEIITNDMTSPMHKMIAMYINAAKCFWENMLRIPQKGSWSKVAPLKKYVENIMFMQTMEFTSNIERYGG